MHHYFPKLPLKFILLWVANIALLLAVTFATDLQKTLLQMQIKNLAYLYLGVGAVMAALEQALWNKLKGN